MPQTCEKMWYMNNDTSVLQGSKFVPMMAWQNLLWDTVDFFHLGGCGYRDGEDDEWDEGLGLLGEENTSNNEYLIYKIIKDFWWLSELYDLKLWQIDLCTNPTMLMSHTPQCTIL